MRKVAIVGSRDYPDLDAVRDYILDVYTDDGTPFDMEIVSGGARGIDSMAEAVAKQLRMPTKIFLPDWEKYSQSAGLKRNTQIVEYADEGVVFWNGTSRGCIDTFNKFLLREKKVTLICEKTQTGHVSAWMLRKSENWGRW